MLNHVGKYIDAYRLICLLETDSSGEIYLGEHLDNQTLAAVKLLNVDQDNLKLFVQEASTIFHLKHPHILSLLAFGMSAYNIAYLIMDYAPNGTLRQRHPQGTRLPLDIVASYVLPLATALQYTHDRSIIHRNISPEHIFLDKDWNILLSDFIMFFTSFDQKIPSSDNVTRTFAYRAPEQRYGQPQIASDQYALGVMTYEWLCGELPFQGPQGETPDQHSSRIREKLADLPSPIQESILKALAYEPQDRFARVEEFAAAFQQFTPVRTPAVVLSSPSLLSTTTSLQMGPHPEASTILTYENTHLSTSSSLAPNELPSSETLADQHQSTTALRPISLSSKTTPDSSLVSNPFLSPPNNFLILQRSKPVPLQPPATRRRLTRGRIEIFIIELLLLLGVGCILFFLAVGMNVVKFPSRMTKPTPSPQLLAATAAARAYATETAANGTMLGFNSAHTHWNPYEKVLNRKTISQLKLHWSYSTNSEIASSPVVANGIVYVGSYDGKLYAFDTSCHKTCLPLWSYATGNAIISSPAVANGLVYVGSYDHKFYAFDANCRSACQPLWSYTTGNVIYSSPTIANGLVYVGSDDDKLYAFDDSCRSACLPLWSYTIGDVIHSSPTVANGLVYVGSATHKLYAFDANCRSACLPLWFYATDGPIGSSPTVANGLVYVSSEDNKLYAFDASCHSACLPLWSYATDGPIFSSPAVTNGLVYVGSEDNKLYAFDASCHSACLPLWSYDTGDVIYSSPTIANGIIYIGSWNNDLYAFDASCRSACLPLWSYATNGHIVSSPAIANGVVYIGSYDNKLYAFGIQLK